MDLGPNRGVPAAVSFAFSIALALACLLAGAARAATITVDTTTTGIHGDGQCSLSEAIDNANADANDGGDHAGPIAGVVYPSHTDCGAGGGADTIVLPVGATFTYTAPNQSGESGPASYRFWWYGPEALPAIASDITIEGNGAVIERSSAGGTPPFRFFYVGADPGNADTLNYTSPGPGKLTLQNLTLSNGLAKGGNSNSEGGGAGMGGAIFSQGRVTLESVTLNGNSAQGGNSVASAAYGQAGGGIGEDAPTSNNGGGFGGGFSGIGASGGSGDNTFGGGGGGAGFALGETGNNAGATGNGADGGGSATGTGGGTSSGGSGGDGSGGGGGGGSLGAIGGGGGDFGKGGFSGSVGGGAGLGGAIFNMQGTLTLQNSTLAGNSAAGGTAIASSRGRPGSGYGGAVFNLNGTVDVSFSTIARNSADDGGAIYNLVYDSVTARTAALTLTDSVLADSTATNDLVSDKPASTSAGANLGSATVTGVGSSIVMSGAAQGGADALPGFGTSDPLLATALAANGATNAPGTLALQSGSPALDAAAGTGCPAADERGIARPQGPQCDLGAFELGQPLISLTPASVDFGNVMVGQASTPQTVKLENTGAADLAVGTLAVSGADSGDFALGGDSCTGQTIAPAATCSFEVTLTPSATGTRAAQVDVPSDAFTSPDAVALAGTGLQGGVNLTPASVDFGSVTVGQASAPQTVMLENTGNGDLAVGTLAVSGADSGDFALGGDTCTGQTIAPAATCSFTVTFTPTATGARNAQVDVPSNAPGSPGAVALTGTGQAAVQTSFQVQAATGTGSINGQISGGGPACTVSQASATTAAAAAGGPPPGVVFPHGLVGFTLEGCTPGAAVTVTLTFPAALPAGTGYFKYGPTPDDATPHWYSMPAGIAGAGVTLNIPDGGLGDDDLSANGSVLDAGGPGVNEQAAAVPIPAQGKLALLALLLTITVGAWRRRGGSAG